MQKYIALLRGINVGGKRKIKMVDLKESLGQLKFLNIITYIQSGNVIFQSDEPDVVKLADKIHDSILKDFDLEVPVQVFSKDSWSDLLVSNPYFKTGEEDISKMHVTFLATTPTKEKLSFVDNYNACDDQLEIRSLRVYLFLPNGYGRTKLNNSFFESKLKVPATTRNWKTISKLDELSSE